MYTVILWLCFLLEDLKVDIVQSVLIPSIISGLSALVFSSSRCRYSTESSSTWESLHYREFRYCMAQPEQSSHCELTCPDWGQGGGTQLPPLGKHKPVLRNHFLVLLSYCKHFFGHRAKYSHVGMRVQTLTAGLAWCHDSSHLLIIQQTIIRHTLNTRCFVRC